MKTREKTLFTIGLVVALGIGFVIGISIDFPKPNQSDLAGTFGKAEKFRKVQMTQKDIQLRSELLKDTAQLRSMIQGLVYFSVFTEEVSTNIELSVMAFTAQGMGNQADEAIKIKALQDYSGFIRNNNITLNSTIALLTGLYLEDTASPSVDVEKNVSDFAAYVNGLSDRNTALSQALASMDNFMIGSKTLQANREQITQLKSIRDQLLVKGIQLGAVIGNDKQVQALIVAAFDAQEQFQRTARDQVVQGYEQARQDLKFVDTVEAMAGLSVEGNFMNYAAPSASVIFYDKPSQLFTMYTASEQQLQKYTANPAIQMVATIGGRTNGGIGVKLDNYNMQDVLGRMPGRFDAAANIFSMGDLRISLFDSIIGLTGFINFSAREALHAI